MPYRQSFQGDYRAGYQGGFGLALLGGLAKKGIGALIKKKVPTMARGAATAAAAGVGLGMVRQAPRLPIPMPGGGTVRPFAAAPGGTPFITPGECPKGYRLNKSGYFLKSGAYIPPRSKCVKVRRRNFANGRALRGAISRARGFERLVSSNRKSLRKLSKI